MRFEPFEPLFPPTLVALDILHFRHFGCGYAVPGNQVCSREMPRLVKAFYVYNVVPK